MLVLRTAREVAAAELGVSLDQVRPETAIPSGAASMLERLHRRIMDELEREGALDPPSNGDSSKDAGHPGPEQLGITLSNRGATTVAALAAAETHAVVRLLMGQRLDVPARELSPDLHLAHDLDADSLTRVDLVLLLEEALDVSVPDDSMSLVQTVGDAELFSVLFDRTREEIILSLGERADELDLDTPLAEVGDPDGRVAIAAAARAIDSDLPFCRCPCPTLKDAVRLAFLADKVREVLGRGSGTEAAEITISTIPERDLSLSPEKVRELLGGLATTLDIDPVAVSGSSDRSIAATVTALAEASIQAAEGPLR